MSTINSNTSTAPNSGMSTPGVSPRGFLTTEMPSTPSSTRDTLINVREKLTRERSSWDVFKNFLRSTVQKLMFWKSYQTHDIPEDPLIENGGSYKENYRQLGKERPKHMKKTCAAFTKIYEATEKDNIASETTLRCLQTIISSEAGGVPISVNSLKEGKQKTLKDTYFTPSAERAEPSFAALVLKDLGYKTKLVMVHGKPNLAETPKDAFDTPVDFSEFRAKLINHFSKTDPAPIMIHNGHYAVNIVGVSSMRNKDAEMILRLWIADPRVKGEEGLYSIDLNIHGERAEKIQFDSEGNAKPLEFRDGPKIAFDKESKWMALFATKDEEILEIPSPVEYEYEEKMIISSFAKGIKMDLSVVRAILKDHPEEACRRCGIKNLYPLHFILSNSELYDEELALLLIQCDETRDIAKHICPNNNFKDTALSLAIQKGSARIVKALLEIDGDKQIELLEKNFGDIAEFAKKFPNNSAVVEVIEDFYLLDVEEI